MLNVGMEAVLGTALRVFCVLALALLVTGVFMRRTSSAARHFVWVLATGAVLWLPLLTLVVPKLPMLPRLAVFASEEHMVVEVLPGDVVHAPFIVELAPGHAPHAPMIHVAPPAPPHVRAFVLPDVDVSADAAALEAPEADRSSLPLLLLGIWLLGALLVLGRIAMGMVRVRQVAKAAERAWVGPLHDALQRVAQELGIRRPVRLLISDDTMPITWGALYPAVLLPRVASSWTEHRLEAVLRHELAHVARLDALTQLVAEVMCALHWYNPLAWVAARRLRQEREHACDDLVLRTGARPSDYAAELLELAHGLRVERGTGLAAMAMARPSSLRTRLTAVLDPARRREQLHGKAALVLAALALSLVLPIAGLAPAQALPLDVALLDDDATPEVYSETSGRERMPALAPAPTHPLSAALVPAPAAVYSTLPGAAAAGGLQEVSCVGREGRHNRTINHNNDDDGMRLQYRIDDDCKGDVRVRGRLRFDDTFTRLVSISDGGSLRLEEEMDGTARRLDVVPRGGRLAYTWQVNGRERPYDAAAQRWELAMYQALFRELGFMAEERALAMLRRSGPDAVLAEIDRLESDHSEVAYYQVLLEHGDLNATQFRRVLEQAGRGLETDHYRAALLAEVSARHAHNADVRAAYLRAAHDMDSDHYKTEALNHLLSEGELTANERAEVLAAAADLDSDHYLATVLTSLDMSEISAGPMRRAFLQAAAGLESDHYLHAVLTHFLSGGRLGAADLGFMLQTAKGIESDHYLASLLETVARDYRLEGEARSAFRAAYDELESDHYRRQVDAALGRRGR